LRRQRNSSKLFGIEVVQEVLHSAIIRRALLQRTCRALLAHGRCFHMISLLD
jgi:hypothetical protein